MATSARHCDEHKKTVNGRVSTTRNDTRPHFKSFDMTPLFIMTSDG
jgi:hypothetical protein